MCKYLERDKINLYVGWSSHVPSKLMFRFLSQMWVCHCVCVWVCHNLCVCYALVYMCESLGIWIFILCVSLWLMSYSSIYIFACVHITSMFMFPFFVIYLCFFEDILCICNILKISFFLRLIICIFSHEWNASELHFAFAHIGMLSSVARSNVIPHLTKPLWGMTIAWLEWNFGGTFSIRLQRTGLFSDDLNSTNCFVNEVNNPLATESFKILKVFSIICAEAGFLLI